MNSRIIELMCQFSGMVHEPTPPGAPPVGELDLDRLWQAAPGWRTAADASRSDPAVVAELRACSTPTTLVFAFGTWCHLSQQYLPPLVRALEEAGNARLKLRLIGIDEHFAEPAAAIQRLGLINVPTLIATQETGEVGRVVETPAGESLEDDLAAILSRRPRQHSGRWLRGPLARHGLYARGASGREEWWLYSLPHGGRLLRSAIDLPGERIEVWHRTAGSGRPELLEVTQEREDGALRSRCIVDGPRLTAWLRGTASGTVRQSLLLPDGAAFATPSILSLAWGWLQAVGEGGTVPLYLTPVAPLLTLGAVVPVRYARIGEAEVDLPAGPIPATGLTCALAGRRGELWLHPDDEIPLCGRDFDGTPYQLTSLDGNGDRSWRP